MVHGDCDLGSRGGPTTGGRVDELRDVVRCNTMACVRVRPTMLQDRMCVDCRGKNLGILDQSRQVTMMKWW